jgi:hypothetical protein
LIPLDRVRRQLRRLAEISAHELANALGVVSAALLERRLEPEAEAVGECVARLGEIAAERAREARRRTA